jgi:DNA invertase Pin-like site-specific DNA recombinase
VPLYRGKCFLDMLGVFAEFDTNLRRERQLEGIAKAKAAGAYKGRPPSIDAEKVLSALPKSDGKPAKGAAGCQQTAGQPQGGPQARDCSKS